MDVSNQNTSNVPNGGIKKQLGSTTALSSKLVDENRKEKGISIVAPRPVLRITDEFEKEVVGDVRYVLEYAAEIYSNYLLAESKHLPTWNYMTSQTDITPRMRAILIDWIVEVHQKFKMQPQTLYICVNVLDRYLERKVVKRDELQLIGCAALWTASKM